MSKYLKKGKLYNPVKVGDEGNWGEDYPEQSCGDCGSKYGEQHLSGCDIERCPSCGGQMLSCDCGPVYNVEDIDEKTLHELIEKQKQEISREKILIKFDQNGPSGNIYAILALAQKHLKKHRPNFDFHEVADRVHTSKSYDDALKVIDEYVTLIDLSKLESEM